jgi:hypothetical protein
LQTLHFSERTRWIVVAVSTETVEGRAGAETAVVARVMARGAAARAAKAAG